MLQCVLVALRCTRSGRNDQLDLDDRIEIFRLHAAGKSRREIGHLMGRDASTISRELRRNSLPRGEYKPASADRIALPVDRLRINPSHDQRNGMKVYLMFSINLDWPAEPLAACDS